MKAFVRIVAIMLIASVISTVSMVGTNSVAYVTGGGIYDVTEGTVLPNECLVKFDFDNSFYRKNIFYFAVI